MTQENFIDAVNELDTDILDRYFLMKRALAEKKKPRKRTWVKWASMAACFCIIVMSAILIPNILDRSDVSDDLLGASNTNTNNISGKRLPIVMTIAETLPSCVAFEYKDGNPYCFYAYDDDGKLYRVLWNNFDGLNEKDRIVVDHNDNIIALNYDEYLSGWTPQYEITAISIYSEEEWNAFEQNGANEN